MRVRSRLDVICSIQYVFIHSTFLLISMYRTCTHVCLVPKVTEDGSEFPALRDHFREILSRENEVVSSPSGLLPIYSNCIFIFLK